MIELLKGKHEERPGVIVEPWYVDLVEKVNELVTAVTFLIDANVSPKGRGLLHQRLENAKNSPRPEPVRKEINKDIKVLMLDQVERFNTGRWGSFRGNCVDQDLYEAALDEILNLRERILGLEADLEWSEKGPPPKKEEKL